MAGHVISLKLLIDKDKKKVIWAESNHDFVDFLFGAMTLPLASFASIAQEWKQSQSSAGNLYDSFTKLSDSYKQKVVKLSKPVLSGSTVPVFGSNAVKTFYCCVVCRRHISDGRGAVCPRCRCPIASEATYVIPPAIQIYSEDGCVDVYRILDNLTITRRSFLSGMRSSPGMDMDMMEEKDVRFGIHEAMRTLNAIFCSHEVLTDVFLKTEDVAAAEENHT